MGRQRKANGPHKTNRRPKQLMLDAGLREEGGWQGAEEGPVRTCGKPGRSRQASARCQRRGSRIDAARSHSCRQRWGQGQSVRPAEPSSEDPSASAPHKTWLPFPYLNPPSLPPTTEHCSGRVCRTHCLLTQVFPIIPGLIQTWALSTVSLVSCSYTAEHISAGGSHLRFSVHGDLFYSSSLQSCS